MTTKVTREVVDFISRPLLEGKMIGGVIGGPTDLGGVSGVLTLDNCPIGRILPNTGVFTNLTASNLIVNNTATINGGTINSTPIGNTIPSTGRFTNFTVQPGSTATFTGVNVVGLSFSPFSASNLTTNGYVKFTNGLIMQWAKGTQLPVADDDKTQTINFPIPFTTVVFQVQVTAQATDQSSDTFIQLHGAPTLTRCSVMFQSGGLNGNTPQTPLIFAIGM